MTHSDSLYTQQARLRIEETCRKRPEINERAIKAPLLITDAARTGTSALLDVLASGQENQALMCREVWLPVPPLEDAVPIRR